MIDNVIQFPAAEIRICPACEAGNSRLSFETEHFPYTGNQGDVTLTARVPVWTCNTCNHQFTDGDAEEIRHAEVCRYLGRLAPAEVRSTRERYAVSQDEWARRTGFGVASVKRWETGNLIQNEAADRYMRLLLIPENFNRATLLANKSSAEVGEYQFQTALPEIAFKSATVFVLRKI